MAVGCGAPQEVNVTLWAGPDVVSPVVTGDGWTITVAHLFLGAGPLALAPERGAEVMEERSFIGDAADWPVPFPLTTFEAAPGRATLRADIGAATAQTVVLGRPTPAFVADVVEGSGAAGVRASATDGETTLEVVLSLPAERALSCVDALTDDAAEVPDALGLRADPLALWRGPDGAPAFAAFAATAVNDRVDDDTVAAATREAMGEALLASFTLDGAACEAATP